eukprot:m.601760 g.601760  ORF g.601760 m.601760 type:complete len:153 (-) comp22442_c0_seq35:1286-1744(-)
MCVRACIDYIVFMLVNIRLWVNSGSMEHTQIPLFPTRPITPTPRAEEFGYTDPAIVQQITDNPLGMGLSKLRLVTARSLAFQACEWYCYLVLACFHHAFHDDLLGWRNNFWNNQHVPIRLGTCCSSDGSDSECLNDARKQYENDMKYDMKIL